MTRSKEPSQNLALFQVQEGKLYVYVGLANSAFGMFRLDEAEKLFKEVIKGLMLQGRREDDDALMEVSLKLAQIYAIESKHEDANTGYLYCINLLEKKLGS